MDSKQIVVTPDRVHFSLKRIWNVGQYESLEMVTGVSVDRVEGEPIGKCLEKIEGKVQESFERMADSIEGGGVKGSGKFQAKK